MLEFRSRRDLKAIRRNVLRETTWVWFRLVDAQVIGERNDFVLVLLFFQRMRYTHASTIKKIRPGKQSQGLLFV